VEDNLPNSGSEFPSDKNAFVPRTSAQLQKFHDLDKVKDAFALKMGLAFLAWTDCSDQVSIIFDLLTGLDEETSEAIFKCVRSDYAQREMTLEIAKLKLKNHVDLLRDLEKALVN
jgi:hypothetical protein